MFNNKYFVYLIFLTSGILLGVFFCNFSYFTFEKTIKITDVLSIIITSVLGLYIATNVNKAFTRNNSEKEILINELKETLKVVNKILNMVNNQTLPFNTTISNFKSINENIILIEKLLKSSHCNGIDVDPLRVNFLDLRRVITRISPVNNNIVLNVSNYPSIKASTVRLKTNFYDLIFEVNKK